MFNEQVKATNPGAVSNRPAPDVGEDVPADRDCLLPITDIRMPLPERNVPAVLSCVCGGFALLFAADEFWVACGSAPRVAVVFAYLSDGVWTAVLLAVIALLLGVVGTVERFWYPTAGGLLWALGGLTMASLALCTVLETFGVLASHWS